MMSRLLAAYLLVMLTSCNAVVQLRDPKTAYDLKYYSVAAQLYLKDYQSAKERNQKAQAAFWAAQSFAKHGDLLQANQWYKKSVELDFGPDAELRYAKSLKQLEQYDEAITSFGELARENIEPLEMRKEINSCRQAMEWKRSKQGKQVVVKSMPFNESASDYGLSFGDDGLLLFSSDRLGSKGKKQDAWTGRFHSDIYAYDAIQNEIFPLEQEINTNASEGASWHQGNYLFFTRCDDVDQERDYCRVYMSKISAGGYNEAERLDFGDMSFNVMHPCVHNSDTILFVSSDKPGGIGQYDIYYATKRNGEWTGLTNLGDQINTPGDELFPTLDGDTLYFSSDYISGMGGLDIFSSYFDQRLQKWTPVQNAKHPINSGADDFSMLVAEHFEDGGKRGYFSSNRKHQQGDDIFSFEYHPVVEEHTTKVEKKKKGNVEVFVLVKAFGIPTKQVLDSLIIKEDKSATHVYSLSNKQYILPLTFDTKHQITIGRRGYLNERVQIEPIKQFEVERDSIVTIIKEVELNPIVLQQEIVIENVYYDFDKWDIRSDGEAALDNLYSMLISNPMINIEIGSHTDCRGDDAYNLELSAKRAQSVVNYLIQKGIESSRLQSHGYGEQSPAKLCPCEQCNEADFQANRRTTFKILTSNKN